MATKEVTPCPTCGREGHLCHCPTIDRGSFAKYVPSKEAEVDRPELSRVKEVLVDYYNCPQGKEVDLLDGFAKELLALIVPKDKPPLLTQEEGEAAVKKWLNEDWATRCISLNRGHWEDIVPIIAKAQQEIDIKHYEGIT